MKVDGLAARILRASARLGLALTLGAAVAAPAQEHPMQSSVWPADLAPPAGQAWITPRSSGAAKAYFRQWTARVNSAPAPANIPRDAAWPTDPAIVETLIAADGSLQRTAILRSSGLPRFDAFVLQGIRASAPFPRPPAEVLNGREAVQVVALLAAAYSGSHNDGATLQGVPHAPNDVLLAPYDAKAWKAFYAAFVPAFQDDLKRNLPPPAAPVSVAIALETADGRIDATSVKGSADPAFAAAVLARARVFAATYRTPGERDVMPLLVPVRFEAAPVSASSPGRR